MAKNEIGGKSTINQTVGANTIVTSTNNTDRLATLNQQEIDPSLLKGVKISNNKFNHIRYFEKTRMKQHEMGSLVNLNLKNTNFVSFQVQEGSLIKLFKTRIEAIEDMNSDLEFKFNDIIDNINYHPNFNALICYINKDKVLEFKESSTHIETLQKGLDRYLTTKIPNIYKPFFGEYIFDLNGELCFKADIDVALSAGIIDGSFITEPTPEILNLIQLSSVSYDDKNKTFDVDMYVDSKIQFILRDKEDYETSLLVDEKYIKMAIASFTSEDIIEIWDRYVNEYYPQLKDKIKLKLVSTNKLTTNLNQNIYNNNIALSGTEVINTPLLEINDISGELCDEGKMTNNNTLNILLKSQKKIKNLNIKKLYDEIGELLGRELHQFKDNSQGKISILPNIPAIFSCIAFGRIVKGYTLNYVVSSSTFTISLYNENIK